jgi:hypothetical protein
MTELTKKWEAECAEFLMGKTIARVRYMSTKEAEDNDWSMRPLIIFFTDKSYMYASQDDEGNNGGALFTSNANLNVIPVIGRFD